jgi:hypothetical protein
MEYVKLGRTGLEVSRICLGCMSYGAADSGNHAWSLGEEEARPFIKRALEGGINFFDTANRYSLGSSEEILGRAIRDFAHRDEVVIATKVYGRMRPGPNGSGLSRKAIMSEIDASLRRLGMDYVDLYQIHRWDHETPIKETLEALHDVVKAGKARYIGASSMHAWQFGKACRQYKMGRPCSEAIGGDLGAATSGSWKAAWAAARFSAPLNYASFEITIFPCSSRRAVQPGGTRQVASYSSTMQGPACGIFSTLRLTMRASCQPRETLDCGPK